MKKKQIKERPIVKKLIKAMADPGPYGWPPECGFLTYQPVRPIRTEDKKSKQ